MNKKRKAARVQTRKTSNKKKRGEEENIENILPYLSVELWMWILSFLPRYPDLLRLTRVCKEWQSFITEPSHLLWGGRHDYTRLKNIPVRVITTSLNRCPLDALTSYRGELSEDILELLTPRAASVTKFVFKSSMAKISKVSLIALASQCVSLKEIHLEKELNSIYPSDDSDEGSAFDFLENMPETLSNVMVKCRRLGADSNDRRRITQSRIRKPNNSVTRLSVNDDTLIPYGVFEFFPKLEAFTVWSYWKSWPLEQLRRHYPNIRSLGYGERNSLNSNTIFQIGEMFSSLKELRLYGSIPVMAHLAFLTQLESLTIDLHICTEPDETMMWYQLRNLRFLKIPVAMMGDNPSKYILTRCSPLLERITFLGLLDVKHIHHLLHGTFEEKEEDEEDLSKQDQVEMEFEGNDRIGLRNDLKRMAMKINEVKREFLLKVEIKEVEHPPTTGIQRVKIIHTEADVDHGKRWQKWYHQVSSIPTIHTTQLRRNRLATFARASVNIE